MKVLIIGASGLVGGECYRVFSSLTSWQVAGSYFGFALPHLSHINTLEDGSLERWVEKNFLPDLIIQCGALTHVDYCEQNPEESFLKTVLTHRRILDFSKKNNIKVVMYSTDYVFDGKSGPYLESHPPNPLSVYGRHKLQTEEETLAASGQNLVLRVTNVYGKEVRGKNFVARIIQQIQEKKHIHLRLPIDQYSTPANAADIASASLNLIKIGAQGIYHLAGTDYMNRVELGLTVLRSMGYTNYELVAMESQALGQPAPRPLFGGLIAHKFKRVFPDFVFSSVQSFALSVMQKDV